MQNLSSVKGVDEILIVDASDDALALETIDQLAVDFPELPLQILKATRQGRANQMNQGVACCRGEQVICLHADTLLPKNAADLVYGALQRHQWGRFDLKLDARGIWFRIIEKMIHLRSRVTRIATGDQAIFFHKSFFQQQQGFADLALMEDIEFSQRVGKIFRPGLIKTAVVTSARRWQKHGAWWTILLMWKLRLLFRLGVSTDKLSAMYRDG